MTKYVSALLLGLCLFAAVPALPAASRSKPAPEAAKKVPALKVASGSRGKSAKAAPPPAARGRVPASVVSRSGSGSRAVQSRQRWAPRPAAPPRAARPAGQAGPTSDRYREIQVALAARGYYQGEPTGTWDAQSLDALRRFQTDQNLKPDGKINALSLIALGLGPKPAHPAEAPLPPAPAATPSQP